MIVGQTEKCLEEAYKNIDDLLSEIERLKTALKNIAETTDGNNPTHFTIRHIANDALNQP